MFHMYGNTLLSYLRLGHINISTQALRNNVCAQIGDLKVASAIKDCYFATKSAIIC